MSREAHMLKPMKKSERPSRLVYFDTESRVDMDDAGKVADVLKGESVTKEHDIYLLCCVFKRIANKRVIRNPKTYTNMTNEKHKASETFLSDFWCEVDSFTPFGCKTYVIAHNAKYDSQVSGAAIYLTQLGYTCVQLADANPYIVKFIKYESDDLEIDPADLEDEPEMQQKRKTVIILSSTNYYQQSLKDLGHAFGLEKLEGAFNDDIESAITYCERDVEILELIMDRLIEFIKSENLGCFAQTIAGQAFNAFRHTFMQHEIYIHADSRANEIERAGYSGGRTEAFRLGDVGEVYGLDINSQYPSVMIDGVFPTALKTIWIDPSVERVKSAIASGLLIVAEVEIETDQALYPVKIDRLIFPVGEFISTLATPEFSMALELGHIRSVKRCSVYEGGKIFGGYVDYFYKKRLAAKADKNEVLSYLYKIFLNSLYGKFGQTAVDWELIGEAPPELLSVDSVFNVDTMEYDMYKTYGGSVFRRLHLEGIEAEASNSFPAIAAHVTSYARRLLTNYRMIAGIDDVYYCDTDSLFTSKHGYEKLLAAGHIDEKRLGALKLEKQGHMIIHGVKDYEFTPNGCDTIKKRKGIPSSAIEISSTEFVCNVWHSATHFLREGKAQGYYNTLIKKELKRKYEKGVVLSGGVVLPFEFRKGLIVNAEGCENYYIRETYKKYFQ